MQLYWLKRFYFLFYLLLVKSVRCQLKPVHFLNVCVYFGKRLSIADYIVNALF